jgi:cell division protein FtsI (penicillin-binding protein 3)
MDLKGRKAFIPQPSDKSWSNISLPWMAFGMEFGNTNAEPWFYNAVANNG